MGLLAKYPVEILQVPALKKAKRLFDQLRCDSPHDVTFAEPPLYVGVRNDLDEFAVGGCYDLAAVLFNDRNDVLVKRIVIPHVEVTEYGDLGTPSDGDLNILEP